MLSDLHVSVVGGDKTRVLLGHPGPTLGHLHHLAAVEGAEAKARVDVVPGAIQHPAVLPSGRDARRQHHDVLHVPPRQVRAARQGRASEIGRLIVKQLP